MVVRKGGKSLKWEEIETSVLRDLKGTKKDGGGEMNAIVIGGDEFLVTKTRMGEILIEERLKWVLDNASLSMMKIEDVGSVHFKLRDGSVKTALNVKTRRADAEEALATQAERLQLEKHLGDFMFKSTERLKGSGTEPNRNLCKRGLIVIAIKGRQRLRKECTSRIKIKY
ncbi:hypothetical protein Tco_0389674 [Tanacetum coccineum]